MHMDYYCRACMAQIFPFVGCSTVYSSGRYNLLIDGMQLDVCLALVFGRILAHLDGSIRPPHVIYVRTYDTWID
jgi:hypothetical protein